MQFINEHICRLKPLGKNPTYALFPSQAIITVIAVLHIMLMPSMVSAQTLRNIIVLGASSDTLRCIPINTTHDHVKILDSLSNDLWKNRYYGFYIDTIYHDSTRYDISVITGKQYNHASIRLSQEQQSIIRQYKHLPSSDNDITHNAFDIAHTLQSLNHYYLDRGYPFVKTYLDNITINDDVLSGDVIVNTGVYITFDTLTYINAIKMSKKFLSRLLDMRQGQPFRYSSIQAIDKRLRQLPYLQLSKNPLIGFKSNTCTVGLEIIQKPFSKFDFLVGILPDRNTDGSRRWQIIGDILVDMTNRLGYGEYLFFQFKRLQNQNQELTIKNTLPYIARLPLGTHFDFRIFRNANIHIDIHLDAGLNYNFSGINSFRLYYAYRSSRLIDIDTDQIMKNNRLPKQLDVSSTGIGFQCNYQSLDYRFNPKAGWWIEWQGIISRRKVIPQSSILSIEGFDSSYDTLTLLTTQIESRLIAQKYWDIGSISTILTSINAAYKWNQSGLLENEFFRIGGQRTLRGFEEERILTKGYSFLTLEYRLVMDQNSFLTLPFFEWGFTRISQDNTIRWDKVYSTGLGLNFGTPAGLFNITFAVGSRLGNPLDFSAMKVHFGYQNLF